MKANNYMEALEVLQRVTEYLGLGDRVLFLARQIQCQLETKKTGDITFTASQLSSIVEAEKYGQQPLSVIKQWNHEMKVLVDRLSDKSTNSAMSLNKSRFALINRFYKKEEKLESLEELGIPMKKLASELAKQDFRSRFRKQYPFMEQIVDEMQSTLGVEPSIKCKHIGTFLIYYGYCCSKLEDRKEEIELYNKGIFMFQFVFGCTNANQFKTFGHMYNNLGVALMHSKMKKKAKTCFEKAAFVYNKAADFNEVKEKDMHCKMVEKNLKWIEKLIKTNA